jgi:hypothetical protein
VRAFTYLSFFLDVCANCDDRAVTLAYSSHLGCSSHAYASKQPLKSMLPNPKPSSFAADISLHSCSAPPPPTCPHTSTRMQQQSHWISNEADAMACATLLGDGMRRAASLTVIYRQTETRHWSDACYDINTTSQHGQDCGFGLRGR